MILSSIVLKNVSGEAERCSLCYIGQSLGISSSASRSSCRMLPLFPEVGHFREFLQHPGRRQPCTGCLQDAAHQAGTFSAGQAWGLTVLDEGAGSALQSED